MQRIGLVHCIALVATVLGATLGEAAEAREVAPQKPTAAAIEAQRIATSAYRKATRVQRDAWRSRLLATPRPKRACFRAEYPDTHWREVPCGPPSKQYFPPRLSVGGGSTNDFAAAPPNPITQAEGSFDASNASSVSTVLAGSGGVNGPELFSLQLNTADFDTTVCPPSAVGCQGWVQFVYDSIGASAFIQSWIINPPSPCPAGFAPFQVWCVHTATSSSSFSPAPGASDLINMHITGSSGAMGEVIVDWNGVMLTAPGDNVIPDMAMHWNEVEFNVFGDGGGGQAAFGPNTTLTVRTQVDTGHNVLPNCVAASFTGETNNLNLVGTPLVVPRTHFPAIVFNESNVAGGTPASCSTSLGDTHITTFGGLYYDFQAAGEFLLADAGPDFVVQARQESGAVVFNNPHVTMNTAVAIKMGSNTIAIYDSPQRVVINGAARSVADDAIVGLPGGVYLLRSGNSYAAVMGSGEMVRADLYGGWMNITVGLGQRRRASAKGILASPTHTALAIRNGPQLQEPVSAGDLYQRYAPSWVVAPRESLFAEHPVKFSAPAKLFFAADLEPQAAAKARAACVAAGVKDPAHLDACTLDAAVFRDTRAVQIYTRAIAPRLTLRPVEAAKLEVKP